MTPSHTDATVHDMKTLLLAMFLATGCAMHASAPSSPDDACVDDFKHGTGSTCQWTCDNGTCNLIRPESGGYATVATCVGDPAAAHSTYACSNGASCDVSGTVYLGCDGFVHTGYVVQWTQPDGDQVSCWPGQDNLGPACTHGTACRVWVGSRSGDGVCR